MTEGKAEEGRGEKLNMQLRGGASGAWNKPQMQMCSLPCAKGQQVGP